MANQVSAAKVNLWGEYVGAVAWDDATGLATFEYTPKFKELKWHVAPFHMPLSSTKKTFSFPAGRKKSDPTSDTFKGLPGLLADSLPDKYGNELMNVWLAQQGRASDSMNPVEMLCFIGSRGMGALEFEPATLKPSHNSFHVEVQSLVDIAQQMLSKKEAFVINLHALEEKALMEILRIGTSAGGARPKAIIAYNETSGEVRSGQTNAPHGFEHWLLKLDGVSDVQLGTSHGYGRVEMAYYNMAKESGINMMQSMLLEENGRAHFMTKRFDREGGDIKHHIQTFCAIKHFDYTLITSFSYEQLFQTMRELKLTYPDMDQMFRRMVFNVAARNCDDHTKNFSFLLRQNSKWEFSPAYDICYAYNPKNLWVKQHILSINGKRKDITRADLLTVAKSSNIQKAEDIIDEIVKVVKQWEDFANQVNVSPELRDEITTTLIDLQ